jgi:hypothetical protein
MLFGQKAWPQLTCFYSGHVLIIKTCGTVSLRSKIKSIDVADYLSEWLPNIANNEVEFIARCNFCAATLLSRLCRI